MSQSSLVYRELRRSDLASFETVVRQGLGTLEKSTGLDEVAVAQFGSLTNPMTWAIFSFLKAIGRPPIRVFVGVEEGRVLGTVSMIMLPRAAYVLGVATDYSARGRGIATHLLKLAHSEARSGGRIWAALDVESENETAIRIYKRLGYREAGQFEWYVGHISIQRGHSGIVTPVSSREMEGVVTWVERNTPEDIRGPLPPSKSRLTHLELIIQGLRSPTATWQARGGGGTEGVARGIYLSLAKTGFIIPVLPGADDAAGSLEGLISQGESWIQSLGGSRIVVAIRREAAELGTTFAGVGLERAVTTSLMIRPTTDQ